ncbi:hypothetical protein GCM10010495_80350 [Kitasatospora herbaricolor]|uniref:STAS domain-containing protein n=1 Tax=Kitasatospora herbaricolor TaxID=68217 RepID=UPI00174A35FA|nr:STAS domain-containing protein [Kitasatospora herbaricolor]MDQ0306138.1 anti-anti-sigma factor [Kitasatospora herbaricolor]GGV50620.1 hypothetical protein GCM10010495_80350 [Kitasatospora herbaricolor]
MSEDLRTTRLRPAPTTGDIDAQAVGSSWDGPAPRCLAGRLTVGFTATGDRLRARLKGEIDMDVADPLRHVLTRALTHCGTGLDIDMSDVEFCDSCGLDTLLRLRLQAQAQGHAVTITDASPQVRHLLALTETAGLFSAVTTAHRDETP